MLEYRAWVIDTGEGGCIGRYWRGTVPPPHMEGHRYAAWDTRAGAREELPRVKRSFPKARVRRAAITVHMESQEER